MSPRRTGHWRLWFPAAVLAALAACHASSTRAPGPGQALPPDRVVAPDTRPPQDASYDWHGLLLAPFGSVLKDIPLTLHEVLLFRDDSHGATAAEEAECYAPDAPGPRFVGQTPDEYLLCFKQDRLSRIHASVRLSGAQAADVFAAACAGWMQHAAPGGESGADACEGREGAIRFSAHLDDESTLSIVLDGAPEP